MITPSDGGESKKEERKKKDQARLSPLGGGITPSLSLSRPLPIITGLRTCPAAAGPALPCARLSLLSLLCWPTPNPPLSSRGTAAAAARGTTPTPCAWERKAWIWKGLRTGEAPRWWRGAAEVVWLSETGERFLVLMLALLLLLFGVGSGLVLIFRAGGAVVDD